ncbi:MAG: hypothetical protein EBV03_08610 [Proteobacteria bacterium]|nr:hypothetical protein [Pseudomonadota bacterium]
MIDAATTATLLMSDINSRVKKPATAAQAEDTARDFESMFMSQMLEQMFGDSIGDEAFGDDDSSQIYKGLLMDAYGKEVAKSGGIGIAQYVKRELLALQEV